MVRTHFAATAVKLVLALAAVANLGCRSRSERDLVERELRMQEDQVYMLESYIADYQEIVRRCRCENLELQQELARLRTGELTTGPNSTRPAQQDPSDDSWSPDRPRPRRLLDRNRSPALPDPFRDDQPPSTPEETPGVPEIKIEIEGTEAEPAPLVPLPDQETRSPRSAEPEAPEVVSAVVLNDAKPLVEETRTPTAILGEYVTLEGDEAPSLHVAVMPRGANGKPLNYHGTLEVMLLDPEAGPTAPSLARWEFSPEEVEAAWRDPDLRETFDVLAGLPAELPRDRPLELWIRLLPEPGGKILTSTMLAPHDTEAANEPVAAVNLEIETADGIEHADGEVVQAGHWMPRDATAFPKSASRENGWSPRKE